MANANGSISAQRDASVQAQTALDNHNGSIVAGNVTSVDVNGTTLSYAGFGLKAPSSGGGGPVPEPGTLALLGVGLLGVGLGMNRRRRAR